MQGELRISVVNAAYDASVSDAEALLDRYDTLTGWCEALSAAGADLHVIQRFRHDGLTRRADTEIRLVADGHPPTPPRSASLDRVVDAVAATGPEVVHVNGLGFPALLRALRGALPPAVPLVVQDHAGVRVPAGHGLLDAWRRARWRSGLAAADAISFSADEQATPWRQAGIIRDQRLLALIESSTRLRPTPRAEARARTGLDGHPQVLWVGRLVPAKDPLTVLAGFANVAGRHRSARLAFVYQDQTLEHELAAAIEANPLLRSTVRMIGRVTRAAIADWYGAADVFVSGSHAEGSGYALIEAMACGLVPVVTAIPSFHAIAGPCGLFWRPRDAADCTSALNTACESELASARAEVQARFCRELSWQVIAARTLDAYRSLTAHRSPEAAGR